jgi:hypothetical protein
MRAARLAKYVLLLFPVTAKACRLHKLFDRGDCEAVDSGEFGTTTLVGDVAEGRVTSTN